MRARGLLDMHRAAEPQGGLMGGYTPSPEIIDRMTFLPVGQYEDGSLTMAWPGFLKDAYEGAQRSYLDSARVPVPDEPLGTRWSGDLDAFNAASIAPLGTIGASALGLADNAAVGAVERGAPAFDAAATQGAAQASVLQSREMQQIMRSLGHDPRRVLPYARSKVAELSGSRWPTDLAEAERYTALVKEIEANPGALQAVRQAERQGVVEARAAREAARSSRDVAERDGFRIVRHDDPHRGEIEYAILGSDAQPVGHGILSGRGDDVYPAMDWVQIRPEYQRQGLGTWLYDTVGQDIGRPLGPSGQLTTKEIMAFWGKRDPAKMSDWEQGIFSNPSSSALPSLGLNGLDRDILERYGLLGP
jgi:GNAT superfamily N-acetyltransferase